MNSKNIQKLNVLSLIFLIVLLLTLSGFDHKAAPLLITPTPTLTPTVAPTTLSTAEIFARVSPAIAFIETSVATGSGALIEDGYVVTNAHVVWPFQTVRVVFPDGSEYLEAPVHNWDLIGDLAVIGPLQTSISPIALVDGEELAIGSEVFLVGYPGEKERFPQPTFTRGLISRLREWEAIGVTYFQTDALIAGGQSGGVLVSERGEVIGISGLTFTEAGFGLVASASDIVPRIERLLMGEDIAELGQRWLPLTGGELAYDFTLRNDWDSSVYVINEPVGTVVDIEVEGENDVAFGLFDVYGNSLAIVDDTVNGLESGSATTAVAAPYFLFLAQFSEQPGEFHVSSNRRLIPLENKDNGRELDLGQTIQAGLDHPSEIDYFVINLAEGETISISVDAIMIDPYLQVDFPGATDEQLVYDDDSGGGLLGSSSELIYRAPHSGPYFITVQDALGINFGGYSLTVAEAHPEAIPVPIPMPSESTTPSQPENALPGPSPVILTLDDLPPGFEAISPEEFGFTEGKLLAGETTIENTFAFIEAEHFEFIFGFTTMIPNRLEQVGFDVALRNPDFLLEALVEGMGSSEILEQKELSLPAKFGEVSVGMTVVASLAGTPTRMDMVVFRQGKLGALIAVMYLEEDSPVVPIDELAQIMDKRVKALNEAGAAILAPTPLPRPGDSAGPIIFHSDRDANTDIYRIDADGSNLVRLTDDPAADWSPAWSPDGQTIAFMSDRDNNFEIYLMQSDGTNPSRLTDNPDYDGFPAWSPDGRTIAYLSQRDDQETDIYLMDAAGGNQRQLTDTPGAEYTPAWSPDGQTIAFGSEQDNNVDIYLIKVDGSGLTRLTDHPADDYSPSWSPEGQSLVFSSERDYNFNIYMMKADGSDLARLTDTPEDEDWPKWSPDGSQIVFTRYGDTGNIFVMSVDGGQPIQLTYDSTIDELPAWSPSLEQKMFVYTKAIELEPDNPQNYLNRGLAYADQGDYEAAIADFDKAIELDPDNDSAYFSRGLAYLDQGSYEPALDDYTRVIELAPDDAAAYNNRGLAYDNLGEFEQALDDYTRAIELDPADPDFPTPYNNRGWVYYLLEAYEAALADFDRAIELSPSSYSYIRRAVVYDALGDPVQAARDFDQALKQYDGDVAEAYNYLAWSLAHDLDTHYEEALKYARRSVELGPQAYNHDTLALVYYKLELYDKALEHYDIALSLDPAQSESYKGRGDVYLALDDVEAARLNYEIFVALAPPGPERTEIEQKIKTLQP